MTERWPPAGASEPVEYVVNKRRVYGIALIVVLLFGAATLLPLLEGLTSYASKWEAISNTVGLAENSLIHDIIGSVVAIIGCLAILAIVLPIHEGLHYAVGFLLGLNPDFGFDDGVIISNPRVVALSTRIKVWENLLMLIAPFTIIGLISWAVMQVTTGLVGGVAAFVLLANSGASSQDLYHCLRLFRMDPETEFANFEEEEEIRTEYVLPKK